MRSRGVYFLRLLHAHSIILYSFLHLTPQASTPYPPLPPISRAYAILHSACKFNFPARPRDSPRSPSPSLALPPLPPFLPVWNPNSWRLVAEGTVPCLSHREIHSQAQLMPSESKSYFVHSHSNFRRVFHYLSFPLRPFIYFLFFSFSPSFVSSFLLVVSPRGLIKENHKWIRNASSLRLTRPRQESAELFSRRLILYFRCFAAMQKTAKCEITNRVQIRLQSSMRCNDVPIKLLLSIYQQWFNRK